MATAIVLVNLLWSIAGFVLLWKCRKLVIAREGGKAVKVVGKADQEEVSDTVEIAGQELTGSDLKKIMAMIEGGK